MLTFIDTTGQHEGPLSVWQCDKCGRQFEMAYTDLSYTKAPSDPIFCPNCGCK